MTDGRLPQRILHYKHRGKRRSVRPRRRWEDQFRNYLNMKVKVVVMLKIDDEDLEDLIEEAVKRERMKVILFNDAAIAQTVPIASVGRMNRRRKDIDGSGRGLI
jgi:hypothetical protein